MSRALLISLVLMSANCSTNEDASSKVLPTAETRAVGASSAAARWVALRPAADASLLTAPCTVRAEPHAPGQVSFVFRAQVTQVHVQVGDVVHKGQPVVDVLASEIVTAAADYLGAASRLKVHRERLDALNVLRKEGMVKSATVFEQKMLVAELSAEMRQAAAILRLAQLAPKDAGRIAQSSTLTLRAPVDGVVASVNGHPGEVMDGSSPFAEIVGSAKSRIEVSSPSPLMIGESLAMRSADGEHYELNPQALSSVVKADTGMHLTWFALATPSTLLSDGMRCTVEFSVSEEVWEAPAGAIATGPDGRFVLRRRAGKVERVAVQRMRGSGASVLLRGDFKSGDELSADGTLALEAER